MSSAYAAVTPASLLSSLSHHSHQCHNRDRHQFHCHSRNHRLSHNHQQNILMSTCYDITKTCHLHHHQHHHHHHRCHAGCAVPTVMRLSGFIMRRCGISGRCNPYRSWSWKSMHGFCHRYQHWDKETCYFTEDTWSMESLELLGAS